MTTRRPLTRADLEAALRSISQFGMDASGPYRVHTMSLADAETAATFNRILAEPARGSRPPYRVRRHAHFHHGGTQPPLTDAELDALEAAAAAAAILAPPSRGGERQERRAGWPHSWQRGRAQRAPCVKGRRPIPPHL